MQFRRLFQLIDRQIVRSYIFTNNYSIERRHFLLLHTSTQLVGNSGGGRQSHGFEKQTKKKKGDERPDRVLESLNVLAKQSPLLADAIARMHVVETRMIDELVRSLSVHTDLRLYEDIMVRINATEVRRLGQLARVTQKSPQMIHINLAENPSLVRNATLALQEKNISAQADGYSIHVSVPRMTRAKREEMAKYAKTTLFNKYRIELNKVYGAAEQKTSSQLTTVDDMKKVREMLLDLKKAMEAKGLEVIEKKADQLLVEIV